MTARLVGILIGLSIAGAVLSRTRPAPPSPPPFHGQILSECDGAIASVAIQYCAGSEFVLPVYTQFLRALPAHLMVYVLTPDRQDFDALREAVGPTSAELISVTCRHPITCWSRDRWITLTGIGADSGKRMLLCPRAEDAAAIWPARQGDQQVARDLVAVAQILSQRSPLDFDGGDFLADDQNAFVTPAVAQRSIGKGAAGIGALCSTLREALGRNIILLDNAPQHHAGMYMASVGDRRMLVGDPKLGRTFVPSISQGLLAQLPEGPDFTVATQKRFDHVAEQAAAAGYRVIRIPTLCSPDAKTYLTYVNGIIDRRAGQKRVYMPMYKGAETMNAEAQRIWRELGYDVTPIDCTSVFGKFGTLHCLVNVLERT